MMLVSSSSESETRPISTLGVRVEAAPVASPAPPSPKRHVKPPPAAKRARIVLEVKSATPSPERCAPRRPPLSPVAEALAPALTPVPEAAAPPKQQRPPSSALAGARALDGAPTVARAPAHAGKSALAGAPSPTGAPGAAGAPAPAGAPAEAQAAPRPSSAVEVQAGVASGHAKSPIAEEENEGHKVDKDDNADEAAHYAFRAGELLAARYRLSELLGDGTFGRVVLAHDSKEDEAVALKIVRRRFHVSGLRAIGHVVAQLAAEKRVPRLVGARHSEHGSTAPEILALPAQQSSPHSHRSQVGKRAVAGSRRGQLLALSARGILARDVRNDRRWRSRQRIFETRQQPDQDH
eukprot:TRINITY_DN30791_c0_g1_i2.p1 TRINITY_DN30791_c0_g1~~TRINITY_DN30791_c0_g1_i2.p1  ORF type:complete len:351 (-),score=75.00 TRINITY_DN30791_c0_g1_i2:508-1560(-)